MKQFCIAGIGELLWDVHGDRETLGGAPVNFAYHISALGGQGLPISTIGEDERGRKAVNILTAHRLDTGAIAVSPEYPTGYVTATIDEDGVANYQFPDEVAWDHLQINDHARAMAGSIDAICYGSLAQRATPSRRVIESYLDQLGPQTLKVFDVNLRQHYYSLEVLEASLQRADIVKLNEDELPVVAELLGVQGDMERVLTYLGQKHRLQLVIYTRGRQGSVLASESHSSDHSGITSTVVDTIGAGDSFTAAVIIGYLLGYDLDTINGHANRLASYVCTQPGAMPPIPSELRLL